MGKSLSVHILHRKITNHSYIFPGHNILLMRKPYGIIHIIRFDFWCFSSITFRLFRGGQFLEEVGVPGENHRPLIGKLTILVNLIGVECTRTSGVRTHNLSVDWLVITVVTT